MKIGVFMAKYSPDDTVSEMPEVVHLLEEWGAAVDVIHPESCVFNLANLRPEHDLYILKAKTATTLSIAGALHAAGAAIINPYPASAILRNKIVANWVLRSAGVPLPEAFVAAQPGQLAPFLNDGSLIMKPYQGSQGRGIRVVSDAAALALIPAGEEPTFAERYHSPLGPDLKIYCIGGQFFGVRRVWPASTYEEKVGQPFALTPELRDIAWRCGEAFGIDLFGVDVIETKEGPYVVDMSSLPGFKGVPNAALRLADYFYAAARKVMHGEPVAAGHAVATNGR